MLINVYYRVPNDYNSFQIIKFGLKFFIILSIVGSRYIHFNISENTRLNLNVHVNTSTFSEKMIFLTID